MDELHKAVWIWLVGLGFGLDHPVHMHMDVKGIVLLDQETREEKIEKMGRVTDWNPMLAALGIKFTYGLTVTFWPHDSKAPDAEWVTLHSDVYVETDTIQFLTDKVDWYESEAA